MSILFFGLAAALLTLAAHPFTTYPLSLAVLLRWRRNPPSKASASRAVPSFSLLVCAHNEESVIQGKLANLERLLDRAPGDAEALIYVDGSSDRTAELVAAWGDPRVRLVASRERTGKTAGLNRLAALAQGEILVLSDANVTVDGDALAKLTPHFADPEVGLVCGHLTYVNGDDGTTARNGAAYWRLEETLRRLESDSGSAIGADGSLYAVRRALWPMVPDDLIDDFFVPLTVRLAGLRVVRAADVTATERSADDVREEFRRKVRIACQAFNVHRRLWPRIRALPPLDLYKYVSHKLLKWLVGFNLLLAGLAGGLGAATAFGAGPVAALLCGALLAAGLGRALNVPPAPAVCDAAVMLAAVSLGLVRSLRGERFQTWQPALSVRASPLRAAPLSAGRGN